MSLPLEKRFNLTYSHDSAVVIAVMIIDGYSHSFQKLNLPLEKNHNRLQRCISLLLM
jgi:hypothetical protein